MKNWKKEKENKDTKRVDASWFEFGFIKKVNQRENIKNQANCCGPYNNSCN